MKTSFKVSKNDVIEVRNQRVKKDVKCAIVEKSDSRISIGKLTAKEINETWKKTLQCWYSTIIR